MHSLYLLSFFKAGISRSPTFAIAYIMRYLHLSADDAYQYVKQRRSQISPNFNFLGQLHEYQHNLSLACQSISPVIPVAKCVKTETPLNDRRRFVQVESCSDNNKSMEHRTNSLSRPNCLNFDLNNRSRSPTSLLSPLSISNLSIDSSSQQNSATKNSSRPSSFSIKHSTPKVKHLTSGLINTSCEDLTKNKRIETVPKSADISSSTEQIDLINTYFQESTLLSKSLQQCKPIESVDSNNETTPSSRTNVLSSSLEVLVL